jgi:hypothetical protein
MLTISGHKGNTNHCTLLLLEWLPSRTRRWWKRNPHTLMVGMQISTTIMENSMESPQKTKTAICSNTTPRDIPEGMHIKTQWGHLHTVYCSRVHDSQAMETT